MEAEPQPGYWAIESTADSLTQAPSAAECYGEGRGGPSPTELGLQVRVDGEPDSEDSGSESAPVGTGSLTRSLSRRPRLRARGAFPDHHDSDSGSVRDRAPAGGRLWRVMVARRTTRCEVTTPSPSKPALPSFLAELEL